MYVSLTEMERSSSFYLHDVNSLLVIFITNVYSLFLGVQAGEQVQGKGMRDFGYSPESGKAIIGQLLNFSGSMQQKMKNGTFL